MSTEGPESKQAELRVLQGVMMILSTVAIGLRIQSRRVSSAGWGWDDIFAVVTWALVMSENAIIIWAIHCGMGLHVEQVSDVSAALRSAYFVMIFCHPCLALSKSVVVFFYARIFTAPVLRRAIWVVGLMTLLWFLGTFPAIVFWCVPIKKSWHGQQVAGHCIHLKAFLIGQAVPNTLLDLALLCLPVWFIWQLQMTKATKIGLSSVFCIGAFETAISVARLATFAELEISDPTWNQFMSILFSSLEVNFAIICASTMATGPLLKTLVGDVRRSTRGRTPQASQPAEQSSDNSNLYSRWKKPALRPSQKEDFGRLSQLERGDSSEHLTNAVTAHGGENEPEQEAGAIRLDEIHVTRDIDVLHSNRH